MLATPVLGIDEKVVMVGNRGAAKIEQGLARREHRMSIDINIIHVIHAYVSMFRRINHYGY